MDAKKDTQPQMNPPSQSLRRDKLQIDADDRSTKISSTFSECTCANSLPRRVITKWTLLVSIRVHSRLFLESLSASIRVHLWFVFSLC
jgi:hypothetical protein